MASASQQKPKSMGYHALTDAELELADFRGMPGIASHPVTDEATRLFIFSGAGWVGGFHFGAACFIQEHFRTDDSRIRFAGNSAGAVVASGLLTGIEMHDLFKQTCASDLIERCKRVPTRAMCDAVTDIMTKATEGHSDELWVGASGRLLVGLASFRFPAMAACLGSTPLWSPSHTSQFNSKAHAIELLRASCHLPLIASWKPYVVEGRGYYDGSMAGSHPCVEDFTADLSSYSSVRIGLNAHKVHQDIYPGFQVPFSWIVLPRPVSILEKLFDLGYLRVAEWFCGKPDAFLRDGARFPPDLAKIRALIAAILDEIQLFRKKRVLPTSPRLRPEDLW